MTDETQPNPPAEPTQEVSRIDAPYRASGIADVPIVAGMGVMMQTLPQMIEAAKLMARADICLPVHARNRPDICFALLMRTENWRLKDAFFVAEHSYVVTQKRKVGDQWQDVESLAFDAAVFQAALLASGAIRGRPQYTYEGEDAERKCTVAVQLPDGTWTDHTTPPLKLCHPGHTERNGNKYVKGSPLWDRAPDQQLAYYGLRNLVRLKFQDVLAGFYDREEYDEYPDIDAGKMDGPASPNLLERMPGRIEGEGFKPTGVEEAAAEHAAVTRAQEIKEKRRAAMAGARAAKAARKGAKGPSMGRRGARSGGVGATMGTKEAKAAPGGAPGQGDGA